MNWPLKSEGCNKYVTKYINTFYPEDGGDSSSETLVTNSRSPQSIQFYKLLHKLKKRTMDNKSRYLSVRYVLNNIQYWFQSRKLNFPTKNSSKHRRIIKRHFPMIFTQTQQKDSKIMQPLRNRKPLLNISFVPCVHTWRGTDHITTWSLIWHFHVTSNLSRSLFAMHGWITEKTFSSKRGGYLWLRFPN
jgi:hypothetical protein